MLRLTHEHEREALAAWINDNENENSFEDDLELQPERCVSEGLHTGKKIDNRPLTPYLKKKNGRFILLS